MNSIWPSTLASLDRSVAPFDDILQKLEAAQPIDVAEITKQLKTADECSQKLRTMLLAETPQAQWTDREELGVLIAERDVEQHRSRLRGLADELQHGSIVHRRAARVSQLSELRDQAVNELRSFADQPAAPPPLPGPEAGQWVEWACSLKEPDDADALHSLRSGFLYLDEFVGSVEPGMWVGEGQEGPLPSGGVPDVEERRSRLLALANELERGSIVHHRGIRVTQANQLREKAIKQLRSLAELNAGVPALPGPEAAEWVLWASSLKEPDDAIELRALRNSFVRLDEFVTSLEPEMWVAPEVAKAVEAPQAVAAPEPEHVAYTAPKEERPAPVAVVREERHAEPVVSLRAAVREAPEPDEENTAVVWMREMWSGKKGIIVATAAVLLVAILGAMRWTVHRTHANNELAKTVEASATTATPAPTADKPTEQPVVTTASLKESAPKPKTEDTSAKPATTPAPEKQAQLLEGSTLKTPSAIPKNAAPKPDDAAPPTLAGLTGGGSAMPGSVMNIVKSAPGGPPKIKASSGVAEGQLVHRVTPSYPTQARLSGIQGTVTLQALIGKDGKVQNVKVVKGPAMLTQAAVDAVKQWQYKPFLLNGEPAEADIQVNVNFTP